MNLNIEDIALQAGFVAYGEDCGEYRIPTPAFKGRMAMVAQLVASAVKEECVYAVRKEYMEGSKPTFLRDLEDAIRSLEIDV